MLLLFLLLCHFKIQLNSVSVFLLLALLPKLLVFKRCAAVRDLLLVVFYLELGLQLFSRFGLALSLPLAPLLLLIGLALACL